LPFRDLEPKMIVQRRAAVPELKDRFGSPYGFGVYFRGGMVRSRSASCSRTSTSRPRPRRCREDPYLESQKQQRAISG